MNEMVNLKINGVAVSVPKGSTILEAAKSIGVDIPTLCYMKDRNEIGACRICMVEANEGRGNRLVASCVYPVSEGMEVSTNSINVQKARKTTLELILSTHDRKCLSCVRSGNCELQKLCNEYGVEESVFDGEKPVYELDCSAPHMVRDNNKCILCRRCVAACNEQFVSVIGANNRGIDTNIGSVYDLKLGETGCISCGQCIVNCPVGALYEKDDTQKVWEALADPEKIVVVQTAPAVRVGLGEEFGYEMGTIVTGKMVAALKMLGFDGVFDTNFAADLTIMEEATEFLGRFNKGENLPLITSCSPGWIKFCEHYYPEFIPNLSSCKSPQGMFGSVAKTYYAEKMGLDPKDIFVVSVMPCTAKKFEAERTDHSAVAGLPDIDASITVRELARMIKKAGINFRMIPDAEFDSPFGLASGAGTIFGATGGVMEAALRTAYEVVTGNELEDFATFSAVRGVEGVKEATYNLNGTEVKVAVASGLANAKKVLEMVKSGEKKYDFIEIMACPGGCVNGGGQPIVPASVSNFVDVRAERAKGLYKDDENLPLRKSHKNPDVKAVYDEFFGEPGSHKAHHILHTGYTERTKY